MPGKKKKAKGGKKKGGGGDGKLPPPPNLDGSRQGALEAMLKFRYVVHLHIELELIHV